MALRGRPLYEDRDARISILAAARAPTCRIRLCRLLNPSSISACNGAGHTFGRHGGAVEGRAAPVQMSGVRQLLKQHAMEPGPDARCLPVTQPAPAGHAGAAELARQHLPRDAGPQNKDDAGQGQPIIAPRAAALGLGPLPWQERGNGRPQIIRYKRLLMPLNAREAVLLDARAHMDSRHAAPLPKPPCSGLLQNPSLT